MAIGHAGRRGERMSVLIRGMDEIPGDGVVLVVKHDDNGKVYIKYANTYGYSMELLKIPESHGDLIDRQKLIEDNKHLEYPTDGKYRRDRAWAVGFNAGAKHCNEHAVYAKTIIEAEGAEECQK